MTEQEFNEEVKAVINELNIPETYAEYVVIKDFLRGWNEFKIADHIAHRENSEHYKFAERLKRTADTRLTEADLSLGEKLINIDFTTGGMKRGEFYSLSASTPPEKSVFHNLAGNSTMPENEVASIKLFIFDYYNNLKPGMVFAYNQEEAIAMIKEAGITGQPDKFYSSVKEIEIPTDPIYIRYAAGE